MYIYIYTQRGNPGSYLRWEGQDDHFMEGSMTTSGTTIFAFSPRRAMCLVWVACRAVDLHQISARPRDIFITCY